MQDFSREGAPPNGRGPYFEGGYKILLLGNALKFWGIFQKPSIELIKTTKGMEKIYEKCKFFKKILLFYARRIGGGGPPSKENFQ